MSQKEAEFWRSDSEYHELAEMFERNVERVHPGSVTSRGMCACLKYCSYCGWAATQVVYYEHRGPKV